MHSEKHVHTEETSQGEAFPLEQVFVQKICRQGLLHTAPFPCVSWEHRGHHVLVFGKERRTSVLVGEAFSWEDETWVFLPSNSSPSLVEPGIHREAPRIEALGVQRLLWNKDSKREAKKLAGLLPAALATLAIVLFGNAFFPEGVVLAPTFPLDKRALQIEHLKATLHHAPVLPMASASMTPLPEAITKGQPDIIDSTEPKIRSEERAVRGSQQKKTSASELSRFFLPHPSNLQRQEGK